MRPSSQGIQNNQALFQGRTNHEQNRQRASVRHGPTTDRASTRAAIVLTIFLAGIPIGGLEEDTKNRIQQSFLTNVYIFFLSPEAKAAITAAFETANLSEHFQAVLTPSIPLSTALPYHPNVTEFDEIDSVHDTESVTSVAPQKTAPYLSKKETVPLSATVRALFAWRTQLSVTQLIPHKKSKSIELPTIDVRQFDSSKTDSITRLTSVDGAMPHEGAPKPHRYAEIERNADYISDTNGDEKGDDSTASDVKVSYRRFGYTEVPLS